jgi:ATP-dependent Clp protease ATP-binding subunit ClpA
VGAVLEIADLDHAPVTTRATMAEIFLQALQTGEAQSAMGYPFSVCNLIICFTMNLPDGADEGVRKARVGFNGNVSEDEVRANVVRHLKEMLSSAFVSRVGSPILFEPLDGDALATIAVHAAEAALRRGASRLGVEVGSVVVPSEVAARFVDLVRADIPTFGARALVDSIGARIAEGLVHTAHVLEEAAGASVRLAFDAVDHLILAVEPLHSG